MNTYVDFITRIKFTIGREIRPSSYSRVLFFLLRFVSAFFSFISVVFRGLFGSFCLAFGVLLYKKVCVFFSFFLSNQKYQNLSPHLV